MTVIEFRGHGPAAEDRSIDEIHAEAFRDLEGPLHGCVCMANIAADLMSRVDPGHEELAFAVFHLSEMLVNLQLRYNDASKGNGWDE
jgi:hypothetical protein